MILRVCDRFRVDPDAARDLDASVVGLLAADRELKRAGGVG